MHTWTHPSLGEFTYRFVGWERDIELPAFSSFQYEWGGSLRFQDSFQLMFIVNDHFDDSRSEEPGKKSIEIADRVIRNQHLLAKRILNAVWNDLNGRGPETGMWWHGDMATIHEQIDSSYAMGEEMPLNVKEDLFSLMGGCSINIENSVYQYEKTCARICFDTAIDLEHGLGILSDGTRVLGVGYQDVSPYKKLK